MMETRPLRHRSVIAATKRAASQLGNSCAESNVYHLKQPALLATQNLNVGAVFSMAFCAREPTTVIDLSSGEPVVIREGRGALSALGL